MKTDTKRLTLGAICLALSFVLSFFEFPIMANGGGITIASFVPLIIFAYIYGIRDGLIVGFIYGLMQFIQKPYFLTAYQVIFDYPLAFSSIAVAGVFKKITKQGKALILGTILVGAIRFVMATTAGLMWYNAYGPSELAFFGTINVGILYSIVYNLTYILPDIAICVVVIIILNKFKIIDKLIEIAEN